MTGRSSKGSVTIRPIASILAISSSDSLTSAALALAVACSAFRAPTIAFVWGWAINQAIAN